MTAEKPDLVIIDKMEEKMDIFELSPIENKYQKCQRSKDEQV